MATMQVGDFFTFVAGVDLSGSLNCAVALNASGQAILPAAGIGDKIVGIITVPAVSGAIVTVQSYGIAMVKLGGTVAANDFVKTDASGRAVTTVTAGDNVFGRCVKGGAINEVGSIMLVGGAGFSRV